MAPAGVRREGGTQVSARDTLKRRLPRAVLLAILLGAAAAGSPGAVHPPGEGGARLPGRESSAPVLRFHQDPAGAGFGTVIVEGLDSAALVALGEMPFDRVPWESLLRVDTEAAAASGGAHPPVLGAWSVESGGVRFTPRFPFATGVNYSAAFEGSLFDSLTRLAGDPTPSLAITFAMPVPDRPSTTIVESVFPASGPVPENLLRVYVRFSASMAPQITPRLIRVVDEEGDEVDLPFVEIPEGLWDASRRRLTVLFHPGRLKRGVGPNETMGTPLRAGRSYRLVIDGSFEDSEGFPLAAGHEVTWLAGPADRTLPAPDRWSVVAPTGSTGPVTVIFPEPMDPELAARLISVEDAEGGIIRGAATVAADAMQWSFAPASPWAPGRHRIVIDSAIEDLAGNTPWRRFDTPTPSGPAGGRAEDPERPPIRLGFSQPE